MAKRRVITAAAPFHFPPTAQSLPLGGQRMMATGLTQVTFGSLPTSATVGNSKARTSMPQTRVMAAAAPFHFPPTARPLLLDRTRMMATALTQVTFGYTV